jgi:hypothetical protein
VSSHRSSKPEMIAAQARRADADVGAGAGAGVGTSTSTNTGIASIAARAILTAVRAPR